MSVLSKPRTLVLTALISSIASIAVFVYLALDHYRLKLGVAEGKSLCNINSHLNCDAVAMSKYAVFANIPVAIWGAATHLMLSFFLLVWLIGISQDRARVLKFAYYLSSFVGLMSIIMGFISSFLLSTFCLFCIATYVLSILIWLPLHKANRDAIPHFLKESWKNQRWLYFSMLCVPLFSWLTNSMMLDSYGAQDLPAIISDSIATWKTGPAKSFNEQEGLILESSSTPAKMVIVEFADYLCPHCRLASMPIHNFYEGHKGVKVILKLYPLDGTCNGDIKAHGDGLRCDLTAAAYCAEKIEHKGWLAHDYIFEHQVAWSQSNFSAQLKELSDAIGMSTNALLECIKSAQTHDYIQRVAAEGKGIEGTPTIFVNGHVLRYGQLPAVLDAAVTELGL